MTRREWTEIAEAIAAIRGRLSGGSALIVEQVTLAVCRSLKARSSRFDSRIFLKIARGKPGGAGAR